MNAQVCILKVGDYLLDFFVFESIEISLGNTFQIKGLKNKVVLFQMNLADGKWKLKSQNFKLDCNANTNLESLFEKINSILEREENLAEVQFRLINMKLLGELQRLLETFGSRQSFPFQLFEYKSLSLEAIKQQSNFSNFVPLTQ